MLKTTHERRRRTISDPLTMALIPPPDESPIEREQRLRAEQDARKVSDNIDSMLRQERVDKRRVRQQEINVLLLGQSESGKSTTLKRKSQPSHLPYLLHSQTTGQQTFFHATICSPLCWQAMQVYVAERADDYSPTPAIDHPAP